MEKAMRDIGKKTKCMNLEYTNIKMKNNLRESISLIKNKATEYTRGKKIENMKDIGKVINNMTWAFIHQMIKKKERQVYGKMGKELNGLMRNSCNKLMNKRLIINYFLKIQKVK
jgi:hypothetical protein